MKSLKNLPLKHTTCVSEIIYQVGECFFVDEYILDSKYVTMGINYKRDYDLWGIGLDIRGDNLTKLFKESDLLTVEGQYNFYKSLIPSLAKSANK